MKSSLYNPAREDRNPRPDLPVLIIVSTQRQAQALQRGLHPAEFYVTSLLGALVGRQFRMIQVCIGEWEERMRANPSHVEMEAVRDYLDAAKTKLAAACTNHFYRLY